MLKPYEKAPSSHVWIDVTVKVEREKAFLVETKIGELWLPKFAIGARKKDDEGNVVRLELRRAMAIEKGLAHDE